jgi:hypothetical protein
MTAFLARLDGLLIKALTGEGFVDFLIWLADLSIRVEDWVSRQEARWQKRTPDATLPRGRHRARTGSRTWDQDQEARADYEWGMAVKRMAHRMEGAHAWR